MKLFQNKVAFITGGSSGIGRTTAVAFAHEGAKVVVASRRTVRFGLRNLYFKPAAYTMPLVQVDTVKKNNRFFSKVLERLRMYVRCITF